MTQTLESIQALLDYIQCMNYRFTVLPKDDGFLVQLRYFDKDIDTGEETEQATRKWYVSSHSVDSEIVRTAFKAVMTSLEHIAREKFLYKDVAIFNPHFDVEKLVEFARCSVYDQRQERPKS